MIRRTDDDPVRVETCSLLQLINVDVFDVLFIAYYDISGNTLGCLRSKINNGAF